MQTNTRSLNTDIFRLLASFFIIFIHISYGNANVIFVGLIRLMARWGVPFFFLLSGYFFQKGLEKDSFNTFKKTFFKVLNILIIANIAYIPILYFNKDNFFKWKYLGDYFHLWFLPSMLLGTIVLYFFYKIRMSHYLSMFIALLFLCLVIFTDSYAFILGIAPNQFGQMRAFSSIPFMLIGTYFCLNWRVLLKVNIGLTLLGLGALLQILEAMNIYNFTGRPVFDHQFLIGTIFFSIGAFILALTLKFKNEMLGRWGKDFSLFIYLYHPMTIFLIGMVMYIFKKLGYSIEFNSLSLLFVPIIVFTITLAVGIFLEKYLNRVFLILSGSFTKKI